MLREHDGGDLITRVWPSTKLQTQLPESAETFFDLAGPLPAEFDDQRAFRRFYLRQRAVMRLGGDYFGVYVKDISRQGIGYLSPVQLLPMEESLVVVADGKQLSTCTMRCRRVAERCYEVGAKILSSDEGDAGDTGPTPAQHAGGVFQA